MTIFGDALNRKYSLIDFYFNFRESFIITTNNNAMTTSMVDAEKLATTVKEFPIIYDRGHPLFHKKEEKLNAWNSVGDMLGLEGW